MDTTLEEGRLYEHKRKKPGFYLKVESIDHERGKVKVSRTGLAGLSLDVKDKSEGRSPWFDVESIEKFWRPATI